VRVGAHVGVGAGCCQPLPGWGNVSSDNRLPSTRHLLSQLSGKRRRWLGRTRTGATSLRKRVLCPLSYEPLEASVGFEPT
jgi:hypothetical protein